MCDARDVIESPPWPDLAPEAAWPSVLHMPAMTVNACELEAATRADVVTA